MTKPLRELTKDYVEFCWQESQEKAFQAIKKAVSNTPVLRYYSLKDEVTIQCDASKSGLGAALLQNGQPVGYGSRAMTDAEERYAQIEKELLAIVFAAEKFHMYLYGRDKINVETDHKPLEVIFRKAVGSAPARLQRMLLRLQLYNLDVKYKKGSEMYLADTLSRAYPAARQQTEFCMSLEAVKHQEALAVSKPRLEELKKESANDPVLRELRRIVEQGWPEKSGVPESLLPYFGFRGELTVEDGLVFKGDQVVVPRSMRQQMMEDAHESHIGLESCLRRMRECVMWPGMTTDMKKHVQPCDVCLKHSTGQGREPIIQHESGHRPWQKVGVDICEFAGRQLLVCIDYYSSYIEVGRLSSITSGAVIKLLAEWFARHGLPCTLVSDNGRQFVSEEFRDFMRDCDCEHVTSSPHYQQSNGKAENAVKIVKKLFAKAQEAGNSEYRALLDWRNTPTEGIGSSPAERLFGRRCRTKLPIRQERLEPKRDTAVEKRGLQRRKDKQAVYYDRGTRGLRCLRRGDMVRVRLPNQKTWTQGRISKQVGVRSYQVAVGDTDYVRNRRHIRQTREQPPVPESASAPTAPAGDRGPSVNQGVERQHEETVYRRPEKIQDVYQKSTGVTEDDPGGDPTGPETAMRTGTTTPEPETTGPRRSGRVRRQPDWYEAKW